MDRLNSLFVADTVAKSSTIRHFEFNTLPAPAQKYLCHAIKDNAAPATAVHLRMTGEIKLKGWLPFTAEQVVHIDHGFIWKARVKSGLMMISGFDQYLDGVGECKWKMFGLISVKSADGPDISRSSQGRFAIEQVLLPSALFCHGHEWGGSAEVATCRTEAGRLSLRLGPIGNLESVSMNRWGNPGGGAFRLEPFGAIIEQETTFGDYTIPSKLRVGWGFGTSEFEEGEFFRCTITSAEFRS
ncbi:MAG TPA: DUF6544 family protein [Fimbriimonas sp.]|nr:DUF6544 family protein [Fimbriimonas sp.]